MGGLLWRVVAPLWAALIALVILVFGQGLWGVLVAANLRTTPAVPWSAPVMAGVLGLMWLYFRGWGPPRSTAAARRGDLRARPVPLDVFIWAVIAGLLGVVALAGIWLATYQVFRLPDNLLPDMGRYPPLTMVALLVMGSLAAPLSEEPAFRGYAQSLFERLYPAAVAVILSSILFALGHVLQGLALPKLGLYFLAGLIFGTIALMTRSILPGILVHICADLTGYLYLWPRQMHVIHITETGPDASFWINAGQGGVFALLSILAFIQLARVARRAGIGRPQPDGA